MTAPQFSLADLARVLTRAGGLAADDARMAPEHTLADAGLDSLAFLQLQTELADQYAVELPDDSLPGLTFGDVVALVNARLAAGGAA